MTFAHREAESESARRVVSQITNDVKPVKTVTMNTCHVWRKCGLKCNLNIQTHNNTNACAFAMEMRHFLCVHISVFFF